MRGWSNQQLSPWGKRAVEGDGARWERSGAGKGSATANSTRNGNSGDTGGSKYPVTRCHVCPEACCHRLRKKGHKLWQCPEGAEDDNMVVAMNVGRREWMVALHPVPRRIEKYQQDGLPPSQEGQKSYLS